MLKQKLLSRKFFLACVFAVLVILNRGLDLGIPEEAVMLIAGVMATYIFGESIVDAARAFKSGK